MISEYENRHLRGAGRVIDKKAPAVRVTRAWRGVIKGQILTQLPTSKRNHLLKGGFVELVKSGTGKPVAARKPPAQQPHPVKKAAKPSKP